MRMKKFSLPIRKAITSIWGQWKITGNAIPESRMGL